MNSSAENDQRVFTRSSAPNAANRGSAAAEIAAKRGRLSQTKVANAHAVIARAGGSISASFARDADAIDYRRGAMLYSSFANDQAELTRSSRLNSLLRRMAAAAIECRRGSSCTMREDIDHARLPRPRGWN